MLDGIAKSLGVCFLMVGGCPPETPPTPPNSVVEQSPKLPSHIVETSDGYIDTKRKVKVRPGVELSMEQPLDTTLELSVERLDLGEILDGQTVGFRVYVKNIGIDPAHEIKIQGLDKYYVISNRCSNAVLQTNETCNFRVAFAAEQKPQGLYEDHLTVEALETKTPAKMSVVINKVERTKVQLESVLGQEITFPLKNQTKKVIRNVRIVNRGPGVATNFKVQLNSAEFQVRKNGCEDAVLTRNQYCTLSLLFDATAHRPAIYQSQIAVIPGDYPSSQIALNLKTTFDRTYKFSEGTLVAKTPVPTMDPEPVALEVDPLPPTPPVVKSLPKTLPSEVKSVETGPKSVRVSSSRPLEAAQFKGVQPQPIYAQVLPTTSALLPVEVSPLKLSEGRIVNQKMLLTLVDKVQINHDATALDQEIKVAIEGPAEGCKFSGFFAFLKCVAGEVKLKARDLLTAKGELSNLKLEGKNLVANEISASTYEIAQLGSHLVPAGQQTANQAEFNQQLFFQAKIAANQTKLFKLDGKNVFQVSDLNPGGDDFPLRLVVHRQELYFSGVNKNGFTKLYKTDGKAIKQLSNLFPNGNDYLSPVIIYENELYLQGINSDGYLKLFKTNGEKIIQVSDTNPRGSDAPASFVIFQNDLYFRGQNMSGKTKLFRLNGAGISQVGEINPGANDNPDSLTVYDDQLYLVADQVGQGRRLFRTDGQKMEMVLSLNEGPAGDEPSDLKVFQGDLYFIAANADGRRKLFRTNGDTAEQISDIRKNFSDFVQNYQEKSSFLTEYHGELYFVAKNDSNAFKIFKTNGQHISQVSDVNPKHPQFNPTGSDFPFNLTVYGNDLYFSAYSNTDGLKLFKLHSKVKPATLQSRN